MATAIEVAQSALKKILVQAGDAPLEADEYRDFYESMNQYMSSLEARNIKLGYTPVDSPADEVTIPAGALRGLIANMAIEVAPDYMGTVSPALAMQAKEGLTSMRQLGRQSIQTKMPSTLPTGSGQDFSGRSYDFYSMQDSFLASLSGNTLATVIAVTDTKYFVNGFWRIEASMGFEGDITGRLQNISGKSAEIDVKITLGAIAASSSTFTFSLMKNGSIVETSVTGTVATTLTDLVMNKLVTVAAGDYLELRVQDTLATNNITVTNAQFRAS